LEDATKFFTTPFSHPYEGGNQGEVFTNLLEASDLFSYLCYDIISFKIIPL